MPSTMRTLGLMALLFVAACSPPAPTTDAKGDTIVGAPEAGPPSNDAAPADPPAEPPVLNAPSPEAAAPQRIACTERDVALYLKLRQDVDATAREQAFGGGFDPVAIVRMAAPVFQQMTPLCVDLLNKIAQSERKPLASSVPEWVTRPLLDCECHGGVCAPCEGVNP